MNWTIACNGVEKLLADWGLVDVQRQRVSQAADMLTFKADGANVDAAPLFRAFVDTVILWRDRTLNSDGSFSGGNTWFRGLVIQSPRRGGADAESMSYKVAGPWYYPDNLVFQQPYQQVFLGFSVPTDPTSSPVYGTQHSSHLFLNQISVIGNVQKLSSGGQIIAALNWALKPFVDASVAPPFQIGAVLPAVDVPIDEVRDITCAEVIHKMLRWSPDASTRFDYTTTPPTFSCVRRRDVTPINFDISQGNLISNITVNARYDLQSPSVQIFYEFANSVQGVPSLNITPDVYPKPLPTDPEKQFSSLIFTVDLQGLDATETTAKITCDPILPNDPNWWLLKHKQYKPWDETNPADVNNNIASFEIDATTLIRTPNPQYDAGGLPMKDLKYQNELTTGQLTDFMTFGSQRISLKVMATVVHRNGSLPQRIPLTYECVSTNGVSGTYPSTTVNSYPEPLPIGLAQNIYNAISVLQYEGSMTLQEEDVSGQLSPGDLFNFTGSANAEWNTMAAQVQTVTENLDEGTTTVEFGPPKYLTAGDLVDLLRVNRRRYIVSNLGMSGNGVPRAGQSNVDLGDNTPEKNSVSGSAPASTQVISISVDGTGPTVEHESLPDDCSTTWKAYPAPGGAPPVPGSVVVKLSDTQGADLFVQKLNICKDGVAGSIYLLCSTFVPDP